ncbi:hypothetical protein CO683_31665 [Bradyrhizobium ottawaense]|nr:hypothetical protein CO683_31665 [Bradyrhizobium ottawaense]
MAVATTARTTWFSRTRPHRSSARRRTSRGSPALVPPSCARRSRVHRTPAHVRCDVRSPLSSGRDGGEYAANPNFGKVEYFCEEGLTGSGVFCPSGRDWAAQVRLILPFDCR